MSVKRDYVEIEKAMERAKVARAEYLRQHATGAFGMVGSRLRAYHAIVVIAFLLISFGIKMFSFSSPTAEVDKRAVSSASLPLP